MSNCSSGVCSLPEADVLPFDRLMDNMKARDKAIRVPTPGDYTHYKGGKYTVIGVALNEADLTKVVIYKSLEDGQLWSRPVTSFMESVLNEGHMVRRFERAASLE